VPEWESFGVERISFLKSVYSRNRVPSLAGLVPTLGLTPDLHPELTNAAAFGGWIVVATVDLFVQQVSIHLDLGG
jgi:hypothetical protein